MARLSAQSSVSDQPSLSKITPPAPNAAALGKFGDIPVGLATGIPQINVPLYSFRNSDNSLNLDVTLDYHAGGVRVDEMASDVGISWVLNAGGAVTRTRRGIQDEVTTYGFMNAPAILDEGVGNDCYNNYYPNFFGRVATNNYDGQNDIFNFNFGGRSGKFMFGRNGDFLMLTSNKLKVEKIISSDEIQAFTITDEKGARYIFDAIERSDDGSAANFHVHASAWYLTKIVAPFSTDSITLEYENEFSRYTAGRFVTSSYAIGGGIPPGKNTPETSYSTVITTGKRLKKINFPNQVSISFIYDTTLRTDQVSTSSLYRLKQISISDGTFSRGYNLYHDYSVNRLTLKKVTPYSASGESAGYEFTYTGSLPAFLSNEQDHWGFYNNNPSQDMIPAYYVKEDNAALSGGTRSTDPGRVKYGSLTRMKYPTDGYTDFEMEANMAEDPRLSDTTYTIVKQRSFSDGLYVSSSTPGILPFTFGGDPGSTCSFNLKIFQNGTCLGSPCYFRVEVKNSSNQIIKQLNINGTGSWQEEDNPFTIGLMQPGNYSLAVYVQSMDYDNYMTLERIEQLNNHPDTTITVRKDLYIGGLRVKSIKDYDGINATPANARTYEYVKKNSAVSSGTLGVLPEYEYHVFYEFYEGIDVNGAELLPANNHYNGYGLSNYIARASSPTQSLATINGSPVTYSRVVENYTNNGLSNGKKECYFTSYTPGGLAGYNPFPFTPPTYFDWSFGQLEKEVIYNKDNDSIKVTVNEYQTSLDNYYYSTPRLLNFTSIALSPVVYEYRVGQSAGITSWNQVVQPIYYASRTFTPGAGRKDLVKTTTTEYSNGQSMVSDVSYAYDTAFNVKTVTSSNSKGEKIEKVSYYPYEYNNTVAAAMKSQNMYSPEISVENWKTKGTTKYLAGGYVNQYTQLSSGLRSTGIAAFNSADIIPSTSVAAFNPALFNRDTTLFKKLISFSQYTAKGFLNEQNKVNDLLQAYIYGYKGNYVIAEVKNAAASEIAYSGFDEDGKGNWSYSGAPSTDAAALSGGKVYNLTAGAISKSSLSSGKSYKVSYWSKTVAANVNGVAAVKGATRNGWTYFEHIIPAGATTVTVQGSVIIDDVRLYPSSVLMSTFTYQPLYGITAMCDQNNQFVYYQYDDFGRLKVVKDVDGRVLKQYDYQFQASITK
ncbi:hypothetical protein [Chitinophaga filiformis]|uniref:hypothetical protein n=1 Tax=Chitinophaga filiformis TaxID=104663 RepID=UPI001C408CFD|nr:hypothetical protein [Chitinophaga filiformis]